MRNTKQTRKPAATLAADYAPEVIAAKAEVKSAASAFKAWTGRGDGTILPQTVRATLHAMQSGYLADGREAEKVPGSVSQIDYMRLFKPDAKGSSEVTFWRRLATCLAAGVEVGDDLWKVLALTSGGSNPLAKAKDVAKVIDEGGNVAAITKAVEAERAERDRRAAEGRKTRIASEKSTPAAEDGIPVTADALADALAAVLALDGAVKRIAADDAEGIAKVRAAYAKVGRHLTHRAKAARVATLPVASGQ